jgi:hypothetical protein
MPSLEDMIWLSSIRNLEDFPMDLGATEPHLYVFSRNLVPLSLHTTEPLTPLSGKSRKLHGIGCGAHQPLSPPKPGTA